MENIYTNRDQDKILFKEINEDQIEVTGFNSAHIRIVEQGLTELYKKDHPNRVKDISCVEFIGGPLISTYFDANDYLLNRSNRDLQHNYLEANYKKIITKIEVTNNELVILTYEKKPNKKKPTTTKENPSKKTE